jgi:hypothetical protein
MRNKKDQKVDEKMKRAKKEKKRIWKNNYRKIR